MAKRKSGEKSDKLYRSEKFEIKFTPEQETLLQAVSESLRILFNDALQERRQAYDKYVRPLRAKLRLRPDRTSLERKLKFAYKQRIPTLFDQINDLTARRAGDPAFRAVPRNWQEETLDNLNASYTSFYGLRKKKDPDARTPRTRREGEFHKIPGRGGFKVTENGLVLSCSGQKFCFPIPQYQRERLQKALKFKKFELYRDERRLDQPGRYWISVAYELPKPPTTDFRAGEAVYLAIGASSIGVLSSRGEEVLKIWRSDKHWMPKIEKAKKAMDSQPKGSRERELLAAQAKRMHAISSRQRLQDEREVVQYLLQRYGNHFVVKDVVVRSKEGKLADSSKPERGGALGLNWMAQNTGSISRLVMLLEDKAREYRGSVRKHKLVLDQYPPGTGHNNKLWMARKLRESFLASQSAQ